MKVKNMTAGTLVRTVTLVVALLNLVLTSFGKNPLPFSDEQIYTGLSALVTVAAALAAWWKNNSFTCCARQADEVATRGLHRGRERGRDLGTGG